MTRIIGIDLGTTNSALAVAGDDEPAHSLGITQVVGPGEIAERPTLPSFLLLPSETEVPPAQLQLPWSGPLRYAVGTFARERGAELPHRLVSSAKSWLCNPSIDRTAQVLPFRGAQRELDEAMQGGERVSPVNASRATSRTCAPRGTTPIPTSPPTSRKCSSPCRRASTRSRAS